jgi:hypothetical protein
MDTIIFTPEVLAGITGLLLTLLFAYFPKLRVWYGGLQSEVKSYIMIGLLFITAVGITLLAQSGLIQTAEPVTWLFAAKVFFAALIVNQPTYMLLPKAVDVKAANLKRRYWSDKLQ